MESNNREKSIMTIEDYRQKIDGLDDQILVLLNQRAAFAAEIGIVKRSLGMAVYDPEREIKILNRLVHHNKGPLDEKSVRTLFERIIDESRRIERHITDNQ
ncbi:chorismate mutase [candidate division KSB1 bacterium]